MRAPTYLDLDAVAELVTSTGIAVAPEVMRVDWSREGFSLERDAWIWTDGAGVSGYGVLYPGGAGDLATRDAGLREVILDRVLARAAELAEPQVDLIVPAIDVGLLGLLRERGFREQDRILSYSGELQPTDPGDDVDISSVTSEAEERALFDLADQAWGPDFAVWRDWVSGFFEFDPSLMLVAREDGQVVGGLVAIAFPPPMKGWVRRVAIAERPDRLEIGVALLRAVARRLYDRGLRTWGMPVPPDETDYLHEIAGACGMGRDSEVVIVSLTR